MRKGSSDDGIKTWQKERLGIDQGGANEAIKVNDRLEKDTLAHILNSLNAKLNTSGPIASMLTKHYIYAVFLLACKIKI